MAAIWLSGPVAGFLGGAEAGLVGKWMGGDRGVEPFRADGLPSLAIPAAWIAAAVIVWRTMPRPGPRDPAAPERAFFITGCLIAVPLPVLLGYGLGHSG